MATTDNNQPLRIGELAAELGVNTKTIRYYEGIGLLPAPRRTEAGYRLYGAADRDRLAFIRKARAIGLTLEEIGRLLTLRREGQRPCMHLLTLLDTKLAAVDEQLRALNDFRVELVTLRAEASGTNDDEGCICAIIEHHRPARTAPDAAIPLARPVPHHR